MSLDELSKYLASIGSKGGKARAKALTKKEQRIIALRASKAAAKARSAKAQP
jgi:phage gp16-like protein